MENVREQIKRAAEAPGDRSREMAAKDVEKTFEQALGGLAQRIAAEEGVEYGRKQPGRGV